MADLLKLAKRELLKEWDYERNADVDIERVRVNASDSVWWICPKNSIHRWQARVRNRAVDGNGCPYCSGRKTMRLESLGVLYPVLTAELHPTRNPGFDPFLFSPGSNKTVWWICSKGHEWRSQIARRVKTGSGCRKCSYVKGRATVAGSSFNHEFHPTKNGRTRADAVTLGSRQRIWRQCVANPSHIWKESVHYRVKMETKCPHCHPRMGTKGLTLAEFSAVLSHEWYSKFNDPLTPNDVSAGAKRKVWWKCGSNLQHPPWQASIYNRTHLKHGCPACYERSFNEGRSIARMFPRLVAEWHPQKNGDLTPHNVTFGSSRRIWWKCVKDPSHEWEAVVNVRTRNGRGCPFCSRHRVTSDRSLAVCFPQVAAEWHPIKNGDETANAVAAKSARKVWWRCSVNSAHEWLAQIKNRTILGSGCPHCAQENNVFQIIRELEKSAYNTTEVYRVFLLNMQNVERLTKTPVATAALKTVYFRMLYAQVITALEAYLADSFLRLVISKPGFKKRLLTEVNEFKERKFSFADILEMNPSGDEAIADMLSAISWHNIAKARALYATVLGIEFPGDLAPLFKAVTNRHDIVHRNGRSIKGHLVSIGEFELVTLMTGAKDFVRALDEKLTALGQDKR